MDEKAMEITKPLLLVDQSEASGWTERTEELGRLPILLRDNSKNSRKVERILNRLKIKHVQVFYDGEARTVPSIIVPGNTYPYDELWSIRHFIRGELAMRKTVKAMK